MFENKEIEVAIKDKYLLTVEQATKYFNIGPKKLRQFISEHLHSGIVVTNGVKYLINRKKFEEYLDGITSI